MGKKSKLKRERRELKAIKTVQSELFQNLMSLDGYNEPIYRFFSERWQADSLCEGKVWLSTLETCRAYEDPLQGDDEEAIHTYTSGHIVGGSSNEAFVEMAARSGIYIGEGCSNITINNATQVQKLPDAFVLCTTKELQPEKLSDTFGNYCVKISNPAEFFKRISIVLNKHFAIKEGGMGLIQYKDRVYTGLETPPGPIGFVKPSDLYSPQKEFRMLWVPEDTVPIDPFLLNCPDVANLCSQVT